MSQHEEFLFLPVSEEDIAREKSKARELRRSQWWKRRLAAGRCYYCERAVAPRELTMDHIVPLVRGGRTTRSNVVPCCKECNAQKRYLLPLEWEEYLARLRG
ncbi:MAG: HNH endonuclease [Candidatus Latescibacterota bacterium]